MKTIAAYRRRKVGAFAAVAALMLATTPNATHGQPAPLPDMVPPVMKERDGAERIEIVLPDGCRLLVGSDVSLPALRRVVTALRR